MSSETSGERIGDASGLAAALARLGMPCAVESRARLALLAAPAGVAERLARIEARREVIALAKSHGFTHVALELAGSSSVVSAPVLRD